MSQTHVNAFKMEFEEALTDVEKAINEARVKYRAFVTKLEEHTGAIERIVPGVTPVMAAEPTTPEETPVDEPAVEAPEVAEEKK